MLANIDHLPYLTSYGANPLKYLGWVQKCKEIANILHWIHLPNDEGQQDKTIASNFHIWTQPW